MGVKSWAVTAALLALFAAASVASAGGGNRGIDDPPGNPLYVIIEVTWDGDTSHAGSWTVWGPRFDPEVGTGTILAACPGGGPPGSCLDFSGFTYELRGRTLQFDEVYVPGVQATPQSRHVVLHDPDGDGTYTGSLGSARYIWGGADPNSTLYHDRIDYEVTLDGAGNVTTFRYLQYEHKKEK